jgi:hypothetical protein
VFHYQGSRAVTHGLGGSKRSHDRDKLFVDDPVPLWRGWQRDNLRRADGLGSGVKVWAQIALRKSMTADQKYKKYKLGYSQPNVLRELRPIAACLRGVRRKNYRDGAVGDVLKKVASARPTRAEVFFNEIGEQFPFRERLNSTMRKSFLGVDCGFPIGVPLK